MAIIIASIGWEGAWRVPASKDKLEMCGLREKLLEAHVQHELARWQSEAIEERLAEGIHHLFRWFGETKLDDMVARAQIRGVIQRYVIDFRVSGGITELSGQISRTVFTSQTCAGVRLDEVFPPASYAEFADKVLALEGAVRELITRVTHSESALAIGARLTVRNVLKVISPTTALPLDETSVLVHFEQRIRPAVERLLSKALERYLSYDRHPPGQTDVEIFEALQPDQLRSVLDDLWARFASMRLSEVFAFVGEQDIEDFVVLVYEFWNRYRKTVFFRRVTEEIVDFFFTKYGQESVAALIEDMGVTEAMVCHELNVFLAPLLQRAAQSGALEQAIRTRLASFYQTPSAGALFET